MNFTPILAQAAPGAGDLFGMIVPMVGIMAVFYWFMIRPQQQKQKEHQDKLTKVQKGDTVISNGGLVGKVIKVTDEHELLVEIGPNVQVRMLRQGLSDVKPKA
jgi:preprotein translocase subunit YajC